MTPRTATAPGAPPLTYFPAYLGLFAALVLAVTCNAFLDIQYGTFGFEVLLWAAVFGLTLRVGWRQRGQLGDAGRQGQKMMLVLGVILSVIIFIPMWGFPRAGLAMLAMLQAAQNCVTVTRPQLHLGLLVSAVMVMFAASHYRADWTLLFYLLPYVTAVVFTLVAEQINRRAQDLKQQSLGQTVVGGQWAAIAAATTAILLLGLSLYAITPQLTWPYLQWHFGQQTNLGSLGQGEGIEAGALPGGRGLGLGGNTGQADGEGNAGKDGALGGDGGQGADLLPGRGWPSPADMRQAAKRQGMPEWQKTAISQLADAEEWLGKAMQPVMQGLKELWQAFKDWLEQNRGNLLLTVVILVLLALLYGLWRLLREAKAGIWLLTRRDYVQLAILGMHRPGSAGARQYYRAMERLYALHDVARPATSNAREYLGRIYAERGHLYRETAELTRLFEDARYGPDPAARSDGSRLRALYRQIYRLI